MTKDDKNLVLTFSWKCGKLISFVERNIETAGLTKVLNARGNLSRNLGTKKGMRCTKCNQLSEKI